MRRSAAVCCFALAVICLGCGYIGPIVPPSPMIPAAVNDLTVTEVGDKLEIDFTPPGHTIDDNAIERFSSFQVHINNQSYDVPVSTKPVQFTVPVSDWLGKNIAVDVRTAVKENHQSEPSNVIKLKVVPPLGQPVVAVNATAQGYDLTWPSEGEGVAYSIFRKGPADKEFVQVGTSDTNRFVDGTAQWDTHYDYAVKAHTETANSVMSQPQPAYSKDIFPPATPTGLAAASTADAVELSWDRNTEPDLKGYYVYRSTGDGKFAQIGDLTLLPSFTDHAVEHGKTYQYEVSAVDQVGNASPLSPPVSATFP